MHSAQQQKAPFPRRWQDDGGSLMWRGGLADVGTKYKMQLGPEATHPEAAKRCTECGRRNLQADPWLSLASGPKRCLYKPLMIGQSRNVPRRGRGEPEMEAALGFLGSGGPGVLGFAGCRHRLKISRFTVVEGFYKVYLTFVLCTARPRQSSPIHTAETSIDPVV
jgi:hypothetical protein